MSLYFESLKPADFDVSIEKWRENAKTIRTQMEERIDECKALRDRSRRIRYDTEVEKSWDLYYNNIKLQDRAYEIEVLIKFARDALPLIADEKKLIAEEKYLTESLLTKCDNWIEICVTGMNILDQKLEGEITRDDEVVIETKNEVKFLEESKIKLKEDCLAAWEMSNRLEDAETKIGLNLEFKEEVLFTDKRCQAINKMDTGVSYKVDPLKGPKKMLTIEEWTKAVYGLVDKSKSEISESMKLRERMSATRGVTLNDYSIQFDKTDYAFRRRIYEINKEKNEVQYQLKRVGELMTATKAEHDRLDLFFKEVQDDLQCAESKCSFRFFRPAVDATMDPPCIGINQEVENLRKKVEEIKNHLDTLKGFYTKMDKEYYRLEKEDRAKNKALQFQLQSYDIRLAGRFDPKKTYAYKPEILCSKMVQQLPEEVILFSNKSK